MDKLAIWAVDPLETANRPNLATQLALFGFLEKTGMNLLPVHVFSQDTEYSRLRRQLFTYVSSFGLPSLLPPEVLVEPGHSQSKAVDALLKFGRDVGASWILVGSKGRSGISRMVLGSFAEKLILKSEVPVWTFGHGMSSQPADPDRYLFATDFSASSKLAFAEVVREARDLSAKLTLYHAVCPPPGMLSGEGIYGTAAWFPVDEYFNGQESWAREQAQAWASRAKAQGVSVDFQVEQVMRNIPEAVLRAASIAKASIIAIASQSGPLAAAVLGSNAREIARQSVTPLWIFGPKWLEKQHPDEGIDESQMHRHHASAG